jgi:hypothetical protein
LGGNLGKFGHEDIATDKADFLFGFVFWGGGGKVAVKLSVESPAV